MHSPAAHALLQTCALLHHPRVCTLKDLILAGHVITITYDSSTLIDFDLCRKENTKYPSIIILYVQVAKEGMLGGEGRGGGGGGGGGGGACGKMLQVLG